MESKIVATCNLVNREWKIISNPAATRDLQIKIGFNRDGETELEFDNLTFGYTLWRDTDPSKDDLLRSLSLPRKGTQIATSVEEIVYVENIVVDMNDDYKIEFWVDESGVTTKHKTEFTIPIPDQPFPSWRWDGIQWYPPGEFPMPPEGDDPTAYEWSEVEQGWVKNVRDPNEVWDLPNIN